MKSFTIFIGLLALLLLVACVMTAFQLQPGAVAEFGVRPELRFLYPVITVGAIVGFGLAAIRDQLSGITSPYLVAVSGLSAVACLIVSSLGIHGPETVASLVARSAPLLLFVTLNCYRLHIKKLNA